MRTNTIIKNYDLLLVIVWILFLLRIISIEVLFSESLELWSSIGSILLVMVFGLALFWVSSSILRVSQSSFVYRYFSLFFPVAFTVLDINMLMDYTYFVPEICILSSFLFLINVDSNEDAKTKLFLSGVLFSVPLLFSWSYILFLPMLIICIPFNQKLSSRKLALFGLSVGFGIYLYYSILYLMDAPVSVSEFTWQFALPSFSNHLNLGLWVLTFSTPLILLLSNSNSKVPFQSYLFLGVVCSWLDYWASGQAFIILPTLISLHIWSLFVDNYRKNSKFFLLLSVALGMGIFLLR